MLTCKQRKILTNHSTSNVKNCCSDAATGLFDSNQWHGKLLGYIISALKYGK